MNDKLKAYRDSLTQKQKDSLLVLAHEARTAKAQKIQDNKHLLKLSYLDIAHWATLATKYKIRMPCSEEANNVPNIRKYLKRAGVSIEVWDKHYTSTSYFVKHNLTWTKYAVAGLVLEIKDSSLCN